MQAELLDSIVSNSLQLFQNADWKIRVVMRDGEPWFVASDVCKCLELKDDAGTICRELDEQDKVTLSREEFMGRDSNRGIICSVDARVQSEVIGHDSLRRIVGDLSNRIVPIVGRLSYCPATRNERNHAHSKPSDL